MISLLGGGLSIDRTAAFQVMISRPIVVAPVLSLLLGNLLVGLVAGIYFELLFVGNMSLGGYVPPNETVITTVCTAVTVICSRWLGLEGTGMLSVMVLATLLIMPMGTLYNRLEAIARRYNTRFFDAVEGAPDDKVGDMVVRNNLKGLVLFFLAGSLSIFISVLAGVHMIYVIYMRMPDSLASTGLPIAWFALLVLGLAAAFNIIYSKWIYFVYSFFVVIALIVFTFLYYGYNGG